MVNFKTMLKLYAVAPVFREAFELSLPMGHVEIDHLSKLHAVAASPLYKGFLDGGRVHAKSPLFVRLCLESVQLHSEATSLEWDNELRGLILPGNPTSAESDRRQLCIAADPRVAAAFQRDKSLNNKPTSFVKHIRLARCDFRQAGAKVLSTILEVIDASAEFNSLALQGNNLFFGGPECFHINEKLEYPCALARLKPEAHTCLPISSSAEFLFEELPNESSHTVESNVNSSRNEEKDKKNVETESTSGSAGGCTTPADCCKPIAFRLLFASPAVQARLQHLEFTRFCPSHLVQVAFISQCNEAAAVAAAEGDSPRHWAMQKEWQAVHHARLQQVARLFSQANASIGQSVAETCLHHLFFVYRNLRPDSSAEFFSHRAPETSRVADIGLESELQPIILEGYQLL